MGTVDLALRSEGSFHRLYAVKRLRESYREDESFLEMFFDEARIAGFLRHPHIVSVIDVGTDADGPYLVMDFVDGTSVSGLLRKVSQRNRSVPLSVALRLIMQAAEGLHAAHELRDPDGRPLQLVHRDVSPQNILLGYDGYARVTDFGIAKALGRSTQTATGVLKGKFGYMSPEMLRFEEPDRRSDVFSLGVVLFELLAGARLYENREGTDGMRRILNEPPPDLGEERDDAPPELVSLLFRMLAKSADHRPATALEVARELEAILTDLERTDAPRVEVDEYLSTLFEQERKESAERISRLLEEDALRKAQLAVEPGSMITTVAEPARVSKGRIIGVVAALLLLVAIGGVWAALDSGESPATTETEASSVPAVAATPVTVTPAPDDSAAPPLEETLGEGASEETTLDPTTLDPTPETSAMVTTMRRRRRPTMSTMSTDSRHPDFFRPFDE